MNIIFWDIETSRMMVKSFSLYPKYIGHQDIVEPSKILCISWKKSGSNRVQSVSYLDEGDNTDRNVIETFHQVVKNADVLVAHNGDKFDMKIFTAKVIEYGLEPLPPVLQIDTLKEIKKVSKFSSHRLDFLGGLLLGDKKIKTDYSLWDGCENGDKKAMKLMQKYCNQDVKLLEQLYERIKPYIKKFPNIGADDSLNCPKCGSAKLNPHKSRITASGIHRVQYQCISCGSYHTPRYNSIDYKPLMK